MSDLSPKSDPKRTLSRHRRIGLPGLGYQPLWSTPVEQPTKFELINMTNRWRFAYSNALPAGGWSISDVRVIDAQQQRSISVRS
jgi:hypothetical protein